jgi:adenylate kinase family enzyme
MQAEKVAREYSLLHVSTGHALRERIAQKTALGRQAAETIRHGMLVGQ